MKASNELQLPAISRAKGCRYDPEMQLIDCDLVKITFCFCAGRRGILAEASNFKQYKHPISRQSGDRVRKRMTLLTLY